MSRPTCEVCAAPSLSLHGACAFCRSPLAASSADPERLLVYLTEKLPRGRARRAVLNPNRLKRFSVVAAEQTFEARLQKVGLRLSPEADPADWVDSLLHALSRDAARDTSLRTALSKAGWALR
ncbi:MAG: hypothetical protein JF888_04915 [Candidatus Dormibacteraeota bacterium]|uniref:Uncharacterized protein n=1 Tax=Candidatus Dormiibacter inghamiae TaxID=3127013 RepID=A0A934KF68_9BACT|nr:hypothetical protein [Candidatus Dormibacteraeota bacterium]MBJ7606235.1 hypothetical protein [Candidatus Dormibacteraeota bacterium]